jgi:hypothetical protein
MLIPSLSVHLIDNKDFQHYYLLQDVDKWTHRITGDAAMKETKAMRMNAEDCFICRVFLGFMATPLFLLLLAGAAQAMTAA